MSVERYDLSRFINIKDGIHYFNKDLVDSINSLPKFSTTVVSGILRLDNISISVYGSYQLWWIIALYNNILNPVSLQYNSRVLEYPSFSSIETWYFNNKEKFVLSDLYYAPSPVLPLEKLSKVLKDPNVEGNKDPLIIDGGLIT